MRESSITKVTRLNIDVEGAGEEQLRKLFEFIALRMVGHQFLRYEFAKVGECDCFVLYFWCPVADGVQELPYVMKCDQALALVSGWLKNAFAPLDDTPIWRVFSNLSLLEGWDRKGRFGIAVESLFNPEDYH